MYVLLRDQVKDQVCSQVSTHNLHSSSEDDDAEGPFPNELSLQQVGGASRRGLPNSRVCPESCLSRVNACSVSSFIPKAFSDYQIQQMTANFVDQFGFNDEEFSEHEDNIK